MTEKRAQFDFEIYFTNGGSIKGHDFRLDIAGDEITDKELADYLIKDLGLLMAGETKILNKEIISEKHRPLNMGL
jgi:arylformamidase